MRLRVVCGLSVTIATFCPTTRFTNVDLPAFGRPTIATNPARNFSFLLNALTPVLELELRACGHEAAALFAGWLRELRIDALPDRSRHPVPAPCRAHGSANQRSW